MLVLGASEKRTDFGEEAAAAEGPRRDFLRREEEALRWGAEAWAKSAAREGSLGWERVLGVADGKPWNWEVRSSYCVWRDCSDCLRVARALLGVRGLV